MSPVLYLRRQQRGTAGDAGEHLARVQRLTAHLPGVTARATVRLVCDTCGTASSPLPAGREEATAAALAAGWMLEPDMCPRCARRAGRAETKGTDK